MGFGGGKPALEQRGANQAWVDGNTAVFGGANGSYGIKVGASVSPTSLMFQSSGYTLFGDAAQTITATGNPFLIVNPGTTNTIGTNVTVSVGSGVFVLGAAVSGTAGGALNIENGAALTSGKSLTINGTGTVVTVKKGGKIPLPMPPARSWHLETVWVTMLR